MLQAITLWLMTLLGVCPSDMAPVGWFVCMDRYEAPNIEGSLPMAMQSAQDGLRWCQERGRRLCAEDEWEAACRASEGPCNNDKQWRPWDRKTVDQAGEIARLWQGTPSGSYPSCRTPSGIYDLVGNVEEWVVSKKAGPHTKARDWPYTLKGGWWAKITACGKTNDAHEPWFRFYETGFRCCL